ncbi:hypothetical protein pdul_cds_273 [Pandoravirus dulcis]|uniref:OxoGdeHyase C incomplete domain containing protein n=1 Tax=Pandoravirus dulcis TaxID=1349409 RepID=S4VS61_9VIRU|nr:hypothetical protein pdul_cds_273 [Pandoravirus dulcis]AGO82250.1 hypothetical protein pdul_cds_273 [Pandoravirus dulcis]
MSSSSESIIDNQNDSAVPAESCGQTESAQAAGAGPTAEIVDAHDPLQEKASDAHESAPTPETTPADDVQPSPSDNEASNSGAASDHVTNQTDDDVASGQGEKRKEPDALVDAPTQDDSVGGDDEAAPAKKQKTDDDDGGGEPTPAAPSTSSE